MIFVVALALSSFFQPHSSFSNTKPQAHAVKLQEKIFKVKGAPFDMNGMHLQYQYTVQKDPDAENPTKQLLLLDKKLIDLKRHIVVLDCEIDKEDDQYPTINLSDINNDKPNSKDFDDVNFDGYKDIRQECKSCSGATNLWEYLYLFDPHTKKFKYWNAFPGVMLNEKSKTVYCRYKNGGEFNDQEIKFADHGIELYREEVSCTLLDEKNYTYKVIYNKYIGKKQVIHKMKIFTYDETQNIDIIEYIKREHNATVHHIK